MNAQPLKDSPTRFEPQSSEAEKAVLGSMLIKRGNTKSNVLFNRRIIF